MVLRKGKDKDEGGQGMRMRSAAIRPLSALRWTRVKKAQIRRVPKGPIQIAAAREERFLVCQAAAACSRQRLLRCRSYGVCVGKSLKIKNTNPRRGNSVCLLLPITDDEARLRAKQKRRISESGQSKGSRCEKRTKLMHKRGQRWNNALHPA